MKLFSLSVFSVSLLISTNIFALQGIEGDDVSCNPTISGWTYRAVPSSECGAENSCAWQVVSTDGHFGDPTTCQIPPGVSCESQQTAECDEIVGVEKTRNHQMLPADLEGLF